MARWFRHYPGMVRDGKLVGIAVRTRQTVERVSYIWGCILEDACERNAGGAYKLDCDGLAYEIRADPDEITLILSEMEGVGLVSKGQVCKWAERQYESDTSAERTRRYRSKRRRGDGDVTSPARHNVTSDAPVTVPEAEAEADTELAAASPTIVTDDSSEPPPIEDGALLRRLLSAVERREPVPSGMHDLGPIRGLLAEGFDLDRDVLALLQAKRAIGKAKAAKSWAYFVPAIREHRSRSAPAVVDLDATEWIGSDDPRWAGAAERYRLEKGRPPPRDRQNGWRFPRSGGSTRRQSHEGGAGRKLAKA